MAPPYLSLFPWDPESVLSVKSHPNPQYSHSLPARDRPRLLARDHAHARDHAYLGNCKLMVEGRVVHVQLQVRFLELLAAKIAWSQVASDLRAPEPQSP